jgi:multiple antibiotic resistance protein
VTTLILLSSTYLNKIMGRRGILACERLMGLVLTMIAIQMFLEGLGQFLTAIHTS